MPESDSTGTLVWYRSSSGVLALAHVRNRDIALNLCRNNYVALVFAETIGQSITN